MSISNPIRTFAIATVVGLASFAAEAQESPAPAGDQSRVQARTNTPTAPADDVDTAADELAKNGALAAGDADAFKAQTRARLRQRDGTGQAGVCAEGGRAQCQSRLRQHVRDCDGEGRKQGGIANTEDAARVTAALMLSAGNGEGLDEAGAMIRTQLGKGWRAPDVEDAARDLEALRGQKRWHREARQMLHECVADGSCSAGQARVTLQVMRQASRRADLDARQVRREICQALRDEAGGVDQSRGAGRGHGGGKGVGGGAGQGTGGGKAVAGSGSGDELRQRLQRRLRLHAQDEDGLASGQQKRHRYRRGMDGESRQGGGFGGGQSGGAGSGWDGGGGGGRPRGPGGN